MSSNEETLFKNSKEYQKHQSIIELFDNAKTVPFDEKKVLNLINAEKSTSNTKVVPLYKKWPPISAVASILILFSVFYMFYMKPISYSTQVAESIQVSLPDDSAVWLNAKSEISHNKDWDNSRNVNLNGEAYFEVAKGKTFTVKTPEGTVTVLGTKFNVKNRNKTFEVHCFEGSVAVVYNGIKTVLKPNEIFTYKEKQMNTIEKPNWLLKKSVFKKSSLQNVITDISIQYGIDFVIDEKLEKQGLKYTGSYNYSDDLKTVVNILCQSLNLNCTITNKQVKLTVKE